MKSGTAGIDSRVGQWLKHFCFVSLAALGLFGPNNISAQNPGVICDTECTPNPTSSTYGVALAARAKRQNARGSRSPITAVMAPRSLSASAGGGPSPTVVGSQSYNYVIPFLTWPGRAGMNLSLNLYYNSRIWDVDTTGGTATFNVDRDFPSYGFRLDFGYIEYDNLDDVYILTESDGTKRGLVNIGSVYQSTDGSFIAYNPTAATLSYNNGTTVHYVVFPSQASGTQTLFRPVTAKDANGNFISITYVNGHDQFPSTVTDTIGRVINFNYTTMSDGSLRLTSLSQNTTQPAGTKTYVTFSWGTITLNYNFSGLTVNNSPASGSSINVVTGCTYANGTGYKFVYGDWGIIDEIDQLSSNGTTVRSFVRYDYPLASAGALTDAPTYTHQTISPDGATSNTSIYAYAVSKNGAVVTSMTITDPNGNYIISNLDSNTGLRSSTQAFDNANNLLRETDFTWTTLGSGVSASNVVSTIKTILKDTGQNSKITYAYDAYGNTTDVYEYDFDGTLKRHTVTSYNAAQAYLNAHILNLPTQILVKDGGGNTLARADFAQDSTALTSVTGTPGHDDSNYGSGFTTRGNLTSITRYANAAAASGAVTRAFNYDTLGNVLIAQMDCCNQKTFSFSSATQYSQPDSITRGPSGGPQFTSSATYNPDNGLLLTSTDENGQVTSYVYDSMNRITRVTQPNQVQLNTAYDDVDGSPAVTQSNTANSAVSVSTLDGLGHVTQVDNKNGSTLVSSVKYGYDKLFQRTATSNPYAPGDSIVNTAYSYDGLGRLTQLTPPSAGYTSYSYSGNTVTITDPAGKQLKNYTDALGRLIEVDEPGETFAGTASSGNTSVSGTLQSKVVGAQNATKATGSVTISGSEQSVQNCPPPPCQPPMPCCIQKPWWRFHEPLAAVAAVQCTTIYDAGTVTITVNGHANQVSYANGNTATSIASALASAINGDGGAYVTASASGATVYLTAKTAGPNYSLSSSSATNDPTDFGSSSFATTNSGSTLTGGSSGSSGTTVYDAGTVSIAVGAFSSGSLSITGSEKSKLVSNRYCAMWNNTGQCVDWEFDSYTLYDSGTVTLTVNGHADSTIYSQGSTVTAIANGLAQTINADSAAFVKATAGANGALTITARQPGTSGNYAWSLSTSSDDPSDFGSAGSFSSSPTSGTLAGGSANTFTASVSYGQSGNSTASQVASALASALNASGSPVTATASGTGISIGYKSVGVVGNVPATCNSSTSQGQYFSSPSFSCSSVSLANGQDPYSTGLGHPYATTYAYDGLDNLTAISQAAGNVNGQPVAGQPRSYTYDSLSRPLTATTPESGTLTNYYTTSAGGTCAGSATLPCRVVDARGTVRTFTYDGINRQLTVTYSDGTPGVTYTYDTGGAAAFANNRLTKITEGSNSQTFTYDNLGRITKVANLIDGTTYNVQYGYNPASQLNSITYPTGRVVTQNYDAIGRVSSLFDGSATYLSGLTYNAAGETLGLTMGNNVQGAFTYNDHLQLSSLRYFNSSADVLNLSYDYTTGVSGNNGQIQAMHYYTRVGSGPTTEDLTKTENFNYDAMGRLSAANTSTVNSTPGTWSLQWKYDRLGNRLSQTLVGGNVAIGQPNFTIDPNTNRIINSGFSYDAAGNMTNDSVNAYVYDGANRLTKINAGPPTYTYFGALRIKKIVGSTTTVYIYSGTKPIVEYVNGSLSKEYIYSGSHLLATVSGTNVTYHHPDHLSNRAETDQSGTNTRTFGHFPFGEAWYEGGTADKWKFTSYERDSGSGETGLDYAQFRHYASGLGRFMSPDLLAGSSVAPQSRNRYAYALNDPVNLVDPRGLFCALWEIDVLVKHDTGEIVAVESVSCALEIPDGMGGGGGDGGGGGGGGGGGSFGDAVKALLAILRGDSDCAKFFNNAAQAFAKKDSQAPAADVLESDKIDNTDGPGFITKTSDDKLSQPWAGRTSEGTGANSTIEINQNGAFYKSSAFIKNSTGAVTGNGSLTIGGTSNPNQYSGGSLQAQVTILMHELAHNLGLIPSDAGNTAQSLQNTQTILDKCKNEIDKAKK